MTKSTPTTRAAEITQLKKENEELIKMVERYENRTCEEQDKVSRLSKQLTIEKCISETWKEAFVLTTNRRTDNG